MKLRKIISIGFAIISLVLMGAGNLSAFEIEEYGIDAFSGGQISYNNHWRNNETQFSDTQVSARVGGYLDRIRMWRLDLSLVSTLHEQRYQERRKSCASYGVRFHIRREFKELLSTATPYIGLLGGLAFLTPKNNQSDFGDSGLLGTFGASIGVKVSLASDYFLWLEFRSTHTSDPLSSKDKGRNIQGILVGYTHRFSY